MTFGFEIIVILLMLFVNAVFAAYEMSLASISRARLLSLCHQKKKGAEEAAYMKDRMEASLAVVQLGITFAGAIAAATGGAGSRETFTPYFVQMGISDFYAEIISIICIVIPLGVFTIIFAELVPKMFALNNRESVCLKLSPVMRMIALFGNPVVSFFETIVKEIMKLCPKRFRADVAGDDKQSLNELTAAAAIARMSRLIGAHEEKIVLAAAHLSRHKVTDIMLPAADISTMSVENTLTEALVKAHLDMHTRFPVCEKKDDPQTIIGYLNFKDIMNALKLNPENPSIRGITRPIKRIPGNTPLSVALPEMMQEKAHIAVVVSDNKETIGMITLEDIIEELVGEIEDEFDKLPLYVQPCGNGWIIGGGVSMKVVASTLGIELPASESAERIPSLAEWVVQKLGKPVEGGQIICYDNISVIVRKLRRKKLSEAFVSKV
ncbi:MAG: hemolysin family protein [Sedimentisphaerales bacterium]